MNPKQIVRKYYKLCLKHLFIAPAILSLYASGTSTGKVLDVVYGDSEDDNNGDNKKDGVVAPVIKTNIVSENDSVSTGKKSKYIYTSPATNNKDNPTEKIISNSDYFGFVSLYSECGLSNVYFQSNHKTSFEDFRLYCGNANNNDETYDNGHRHDTNSNNNDDNRYSNGTDTGTGTDRNTDTGSGYGYQKDNNVPLDNVPLNNVIPKYVDSSGDDNTYIRMIMYVMVHQTMIILMKEKMVLKRKYYQMDNRHDLYTNTMLSGGTTMFFH